MWKRMDRDHTGSITLEELDCEDFRSVLRTVLAPALGRTSTGGAAYERSEMNMDQALAFCLRKADLNGNNSLSYEEFRSLMLYLRHDRSARSTAHMIFALFDLDSDGFIQEVEFREIYRFFLGHVPIETDFQAEWAKLDASGRGRASRAEYIRWLRTSSNPIFACHAPSAAEHDLQRASSAPGLQRGGSSSALLDGSSRRPLTSSGRPLWNQMFNTQKNINEDVPTHCRNYFIRPQTLPELQRHYSSHRNFGQQAARLRAPEKRKPVKVLSTDTGNCFSFNPGAGLPGGTMRDYRTGKVTQWNDYWVPPLCSKPRVKPGSFSFRCPGQPPDWMFAGESELL